MKCSKKSLLLLFSSALFALYPLAVSADVFNNLQAIPLAQRIRLSEEGETSAEVLNPLAPKNFKEVDARDEVNNATVLLRSKTGYDYSFGTGMFVSPNVFVTTAHTFMEGNELLPEGTTYSYTQGSSSAYEDDTLEPIGRTFAFSRDDIHFFDKENYESTSPNDLIAVVVKTPMQLTWLGAEFNELAKSTDKPKSLTMIGYPQENTISNITIGKLYRSEGQVNTSYNESGIILSDSDSSQGMSGSGVLDENNKVVGVHAGTFTYSNKTLSGAVRFSEKQLTWLNNIIETNKVSGWKEYNGKKYYFDEKGHVVKGTKKVIENELYSFGEYGDATLVK